MQGKPESVAALPLGRPGGSSYSHSTRFPRATLAHVARFGKRGVNNPGVIYEPRGCRPNKGERTTFGYGYKCPLISHFRWSRTGSARSITACHPRNRPPQRPVIYCRQRTQLTTFTPSRATRQPLSAALDINAP